MQRFHSEYEQFSLFYTIKRLLRQGDGHWEGSASDIQNASKYFDSEVYDDVRKIGTDINKYEPLLWTDGINFKNIKGRQGKRKWIFDATHADDATHATK